MASCNDDILACIGLLVVNIKAGEEGWQAEGLEEALRYDAWLCVGR